MDRSPVPERMERPDPAGLVGLGGRARTGERPRLSAAQPAAQPREPVPADPRAARGPGARTAQPTAPSICSSISRLSSSAYSIGSSLAIGSTKPRTIIAIASSSSMPRLIR